MGITTVLSINSKSPTSIENKFEALCYRIEKKIRVRPSPRGSFSLTLDTFISNKTEQIQFMPNNNLSQTQMGENSRKQIYNRKFYQLTISEYPNSNFTVYEPLPVKSQPQQTQLGQQPPQQQTQLIFPEPNIDQVTTTDKNFIGIINTIVPTCFQVQSKKQITASGCRYTFSDFIIAPAIIYVAGQPKGLILTVEYCPVIIAELAETLLQEFISSLNLSGQNGEFLNKSESDKREYKSSTHRSTMDEGGDSGMENEDFLNVKFEMSPVKRCIETALPGQLSLYKVQETVLQYLKVLKEVRFQK